MARKTRIKVIAIQPFFDSVTYRGYDVGEEIVGWDAARIAQYVQRGLVEVVEVPDDSAPSSRRSNR